MEWGAALSNKSSVVYRDLKEVVECLGAIVVG
jgi:hypothetical protein